MEHISIQHDVYFRRAVIHTTPPRHPVQIWELHPDLRENCVEFKIDQPLPPVVFYIPKELNMLSKEHVQILQTTTLARSKQTSAPQPSAKACTEANTNSSKSPPTNPSLRVRSQRISTHPDKCSEKNIRAKHKNKRLSIENLKEFLDKYIQGSERFSNKNQHTLAYDRE